MDLSKFPHVKSDNSVTFTHPLLSLKQYFRATLLEVWVHCSRKGLKFLGILNIRGVDMINCTYIHFVSVNIASLILSNSLNCGYVLIISRQIHHLVPYIVSIFSRDVKLVILLSRSRVGYCKVAIKLLIIYEKHLFHKYMKMLMSVV